MEKLLDTVKHVEVQLLCDAHGNVVCLGERECSMQRKNQKLIEESPSPAVDEDPAQQDARRRRAAPPRPCTTRAWAPSSFC